MAAAVLPKNRNAYVQYLPLHLAGGFSPPGMAIRYYRPIDITKNQAKMEHILANIVLN